MEHLTNEFIEIISEIHTVGVFIYRLVVEIYQLEGHELYDSPNFLNIVLSLCMCLASFQSDNDEVFPNLNRQEYELSAVQR